MKKDDFVVWENLMYHRFGIKSNIDLHGGYIIKFGKNLNIQAGVTETVWNTGGHEVYAVANDIDTISSSDALDLQTIVVEGHMIDADDDHIKVVQYATLNGQNKVVLDIPLHGVQRLYNIGTVDFVGNIYVYEDTAIVAGVPTDNTKVHLTVNPEDNQSLKAAVTTNYDEFLIITDITLSVNKTNSTAVVDFAIQIREKANVFRTRYTSVVASANGSRQLEFRQPIFVPPNSDVRVIATSNANNTGVEAIMHCFYSKVHPEYLSNGIKTEITL